jgi:DNA polymerase-3 subunit delta'
MVERGGHPDVHRLGPAGPGRQVVIGGPDARYRGVRNLIGELSLMPVEGRVRLAIIEGAERMNEDAQSALLKTLEEPPAGVVIVLCADQETRLLPTVRSRCARIRLGLVGARDIEAIVGDHDLADPPLAARLGRLAAGRPGLALAYARAPEAVLIRAELGRVLLDLTTEGAAARLAAVRAAIPRAIALASALAEPDRGPATRQPRRRSRPAEVAATIVADGTDAQPDGATDEPEDDGPRTVPATERRRAAEILIGLWADVARDLALVSSGGARSVRDPMLLEELMATAARVEPESVTAFLDRAARGAELLVFNVSPELLLDTLALAWPSGRAAA